MTFYNRVLLLSIPQGALIIITALSGVMDVNFYATETLNWQAQSVGQDRIDLFLLTPLLFISSVMTWRKNQVAGYIWAGTNIYLLYTYVIFCFDVHFNTWFLLYCTILGLSFYSLVIFVYHTLQSGTWRYSPRDSVIRAVAIYFLFISVAFYALWLAEILPYVLNNTTPTILKETGLFTNPVHVIDISIILPGICATGVLLFLKRDVGLLMAPVWLIFFVLMDITIGYLMMIMSEFGLATEPALAIIMFSLAVVSFCLFIWLFLKKKGTVL